MSVLVHGKYKIVFSYNGDLTMATIIVFMKTRRQQTFKCIVDHVKSDYVLHSRRETMSWIDDGRES